MTVSWSFMKRLYIWLLWSDCVVVIVFYGLLWYYLLKSDRVATCLWWAEIGCKFVMWWCISYLSLWNNVWCDCIVLPPYGVVYLSFHHVIVYSSCTHDMVVCDSCHSMMWSYVADVGPWCDGYCRCHSMMCLCIATVIQWSAGFAHLSFHHVIVYNRFIQCEEVTYCTVCV